MRATVEELEVGKKAVMTRAVLAMLVACVLVFAAGVSVAGAASSQGPRWAIKAIALPTNFSSVDSTQCLANERCDAYALTVTNVGDAASSGPIEIKDRLPSGVTFFSADGLDLSRSEEEEGKAAKGELGTAKAIEFPVTGSTVEASYSDSVEPGGTITVTIYVVTEASAGPSTLEDQAEVEGGGATSGAATTVENRANVAPSEETFGVADFGVGVYGEGGEPETQAGGHPQLVTTGFDLTSALNPAGPTRLGYIGIQEPKSVTVELPLGLVGNPAAAAKCPEADLATKPTVTSRGFTSSCPSDSRVGTVVLLREGGTPGAQYESSQISNNDAGRSISALYNLKPEAGYPAMFGFRFISAPVLLYARTVLTPQGYRLRVSAPDIPHGAGGYKVIGAMLNFFGVPATENGVSDGSPVGMFTNPTSCSSTPAARAARIEVSSWVNPEQPVTSEAPVYSEINDCNMLQFSPELTAQPVSVHEADTPAGYEVDLKVRQSQLFSERATPDLKNAVVTLPPGFALSPAAGNGLTACQASGPHGINIGSGEVKNDHLLEGEDPIDPEATEIGAGHAGASGNGSAYDDGLYHTAVGHCPPASQIGDVEVKTPLLDEPLKGHVYVAEPRCGGAEQHECTSVSASNGELYGLYMEVAGSGVIVKLRGDVSVNPQTGQITTTFAEDPQLPFEELRLTLNGGQRAPLATPQTCGSFATASDLQPWSAPQSGADATPSWSFPVTGCANPMPFSPGFGAGTELPVAAGFSPFTLTFTRKDGEQDLAGATVTLPLGLSGSVSSVPLCPEQQAQLGTCSEASRIGTVHVAAGSGSQPLWLEGPVYMTGSYKGAPFGLSVVVPAKAGPFNLGNVIERARIDVDPATARVTVTSDPFPQIRDGVPLRLKELNVTVDRPGFMFNPTNCAQQQIAAGVAGDLPDGSAGATAAVSTPFAATGCKGLPFHPSFKVSTQGSTSKANGASLDVKLDSPAGSANMREVRVSLPRQLPSRLETLKLACVDRVFDANPAACPAASAVGTAKALTPILAHPLVGPAYLVSHGGAEFPDLEIVLQAEGVTLILDGKTNIKNNITTSTFNTIPDAPVSSFELMLPEGPHSVLGAPGGKLCSTSLAMPTTMRAQNGALVQQSTAIAVTGCAPAIEVVRHSVKGGTATIVTNVPSAGELVAGAPGLSRSAKRVAGPGQVTMRLTLTKAERRFLALHRGRRLRARVSLRFIPKHGTTLQTRVTLLIG